MSLRVKTYRKITALADTIPECHSYLIRNVGNAQGSFTDGDGDTVPLESGDEVSSTAPFGKMHEAVAYNATGTSFIVQYVI